jgi:hypothetical protein
MPKKADWSSYPARAVNRWILAADIGQSQDPTAIVALNHRIVPLESWTENTAARYWKQDRSEHFDARHVHRLPLGLSYPVQIQHFSGLLQRPPLTNGCDFILDDTGVGRAVSDMAVHLHPKRITITGGLEVTQVGGDRWHVPKGVLISTLEARLHSGELKIDIANSEGAVLREELKDFKKLRTDSGYLKFDARSGKHDDLVLACALATWWASNRIGEFSVGPLGI